MDRFRQQWAYKDFILNFNERTQNTVLSESIVSVTKEYGDTCISKVEKYRSTTGYFPDPNGVVPVQPGLPDSSPILPKTDSL